MDLGVIGGYAFNLIQSEQFSELVALFYTHTNKRRIHFVHTLPCLLYTSDAADETSTV